jgi:hypothetical protein
MRLIPLLLFLLVGALPSRALSQDAARDRLADVGWLVGDWTGVGQGQPGTSGSSRHAARVHGGRFIRVESRSVYPPQTGNDRGEVHTSTDIWSFDRSRGLLVMRQFDSLGFVSTYVQDRAASAGGRIVLVSEQLENVPGGWRARYTYEHPSANEYRELFELDSGHGLQTYVASRFLRVED